MNEIKAINWKRLYLLLAFVFVLPFGFSIALYWANSNLSLFLANSAAFSIMFLYLYCGIRRAEKARFSFSNPPTSENYSDFSKHLFGGFWVSMLTFLACIIVPILIIIVV